MALRPPQLQVSQLFSEFLMSLAAFVSLEDVSSELPPYAEQVIGIPMDAPLQAAYKKLEEDIKNAIKQHHMNHSVVSAGIERPASLSRSRLEHRRSLWLRV